MRTSSFLAAFLVPLCVWAGEGVPVTAAGLSLQVRSGGSVAAGAEANCSVPYVPLLWGGAGGRMDTEAGAEWFAQGGLGFPVYMQGKTMFLLTTAAGTGSHGDFVSLSIPVVSEDGDTRETIWYLSPYVRAYAWMDEPDYEVGVAWKRIFSMPGLSRLF